MKFLINWTWFAWLHDTSLIAGTHARPTPKSSPTAPPLNTIAEEADSSMLMSDETRPTMIVDLTREEGLRQEEEMWNQASANLPLIPQDSISAKSYSSSSNVDGGSDGDGDDEIHP